MVDADGLDEVPEHVGTLYSADISVPPSVYETIGVTVNAPFAAGTILRLPLPAELATG